MKKIVLIGSLIFTLNSNGQGQGCAPKMSLLEIASANYCGPCVTHLEGARSFYAANKENVAMVYYVQAPIGIGTWSETNLPYYNFLSTFNMEYQSSMMIDRTYMPNNLDSQEGNDTEVIHDLQIAFDAQMANTFVPVSVGINHTYNNSTREVSVDITGNFCEAASGDLRFYLVVVQDSVIGEGEEYAQNIMYEGQATEYGYNASDVHNGVGNGGLWLYHYNHFQVVKHQPSGFFGNSGVIANSVTAGQSFTENYTFTLPEFGSPDCTVPVTPENVEIIVAVVKNGVFQNRQVLNANKVKLVDASSGLEDKIAPKGVFKIIENPVNNNELKISWESGINIKGDLILFDATGKIVSILETNLEVNELTTRDRKSTRLNSSH